MSIKNWTNVPTTRNEVMECIDGLIFIQQLYWGCTFVFIQQLIMTIEVSEPTSASKQWTSRRPTWGCSRLELAPQSVKPILKPVIYSQTSDHIIYIYIIYILIIIYIYSNHYSEPLVKVSPKGIFCCLEEYNMCCELDASEKYFGASILMFRNVNPNELCLTIIVFHR